MRRYPASHILARRGSGRYVLVHIRVALLEPQALQPLQGLGEALVGDGERDAEVALPGRAEADPWGHPDGGVVQHAQAEVDGLLAVRHRRPDVERRLRRLHLDADLPEGSDDGVAAGLEATVALVDPTLITVQRGDRRDLYGVEDAAVDVRL